MIDRGQAVGIAFGALLLRSVFRRNKQEHGASTPRKPSDPPRTNSSHATLVHREKTSAFSSSHATCLSIPPQVDFAPGLLAAWSAFALLSFSVILAAVQGWWNMCALLFAVAVINGLSLFHQVGAVWWISTRIHAYNVFRYVCCIVFILCVCGNFASIFLASLHHC